MRIYKKGFTLLELMTVVAIMGVLAAVAIPAFIRYMQQAKTSEARSNVQKIYWGAVAYYHANHVKPGFGAYTILSQRLPCDVSPTGSLWCPTSPPPGKKTSQPKPCWINSNANEGQVWKALDFSIADHNYYSYRFVCTSYLDKPAFMAQAEGNLDGDVEYSLFERSGYAVTEHDVVVGSAGIYMYNPLE